jgi:hypothetical protein
MKKVTEYAMKQLTLMGKEEGFKPYNNTDYIYIEFPSGRILNLSDKEIEHQAELFLNSELESLKS